MEFIHTQFVKKPPNHFCYASITKLISVLLSLKNDLEKKLIVFKKNSNTQSPADYLAGQCIVLS